MAKNLYCFIGMPCAGKSYTASLIQSKVFGPGNVVSAGDIARRLTVSDDLKNQTTANDLFPLEDRMRGELTIAIEDAFKTRDSVIVEGMPRFGDQAKWMIETFWLYNPAVVEISVGDTITLLNRAKMRGRSTDLTDFQSRLNRASKNLSDVYDVLHTRFIPHYTLNSGDDSKMVFAFKRYFKDKIKA